MLEDEHEHAVRLLARLGGEAEADADVVEAFALDPLGKAIVGKDRESHQRDLYESIEKGDCTAPDGTSQSIDWNFRRESL